MSDYISLSSDDMEKKIDLLLKLWDVFLEKTVSAYVDGRKESGQSCEKLEKCDLKDAYLVNVISLREIFERTHQREDYFMRYHQLKMSNFKETGLIAFWITKLKPFYLKTDFFDDIFHSRINEEFALYLIFNSVARYANEKKSKYDLSRIKPELYNELLYTMQYRDLSKEAYGCIVELISIATSK